MSATTPDGTPDAPATPDPKRRLSGTEIAEQGLDRWAHVLDELATRIRCADFAAGLRLVQAIAEVAEASNHHPDLDLRWGRVDVRVSSHDVGGVTSRDIDLARAVDRIVDEQGATSGRESVSRYELALDTPAATRIRPFWAAIQGMEPTGDADWADLRDPYDRVPNLWFQESGADEPRQHWHPDIWVDPSQAQARIDAALAAGGTLVSDEEAPSFWVLADPQGNKACICTWQDRA